MKKNTGYREMLRDRLPKLVSYALKYCRCKERWLDHVYKNWIWIHPDKAARDRATRKVLGLDKKGKPTNFKFDNTILWDTLDKDERSLWEFVSKMVSWFVDNYAYANNEYDIMVSSGKDIVTIKTRLMRNWLLWLCPLEEDDDKTKAEKSVIVNEFCDYLIDCFENRI